MRWGHHDDSEQARASHRTLDRLDDIAERFERLLEELRETTEAERDDG